jgi:hypothetical protein
MSKNKKTEENQITKIKKYLHLAQYNINSFIISFGSKEIIENADIQFLISNISKYDKLSKTKEKN